MQISDEMIRVAAEAMKQRRRSEIEHGVCRASFEEMAKLALTAALTLSGWRTIDSAPRDGTNVMLFHKIHGQIEGYYSRGCEWDHHEYGKQYDGPVWVLGDDIEQEEVEEAEEKFHDGSITHWKPLDATPATAGKEG